MNNVTVLFPGGFKPITGAHMALAQRYAENPAVDKVIMLIGPKERANDLGDKFTREQSIQIFKLLNRNNNIEIQPTTHNSPITAAYEYLFDLPEDDKGQYAIASSEKEEDYVRTKDFIPNVDKYKITGDRKGRKIPIGTDAVELMVNVDPLKYKNLDNPNWLYNGDPISASQTRDFVDNYDYFKLSYPGHSDAITKNIYQIWDGGIAKASTRQSNLDKYGTTSPEQIKQIGLQRKRDKRKEKTGYAGYKRQHGIKGEPINPEKWETKDWDNFLRSAGDQPQYDPKLFVKDAYDKGFDKDDIIFGLEQYGGHSLDDAETYYYNIVGQYESTNSNHMKNWFLDELKKDASDIFDEGYETPKSAEMHAKKIKKLRKHLDNSKGESFVYDFNNFTKTVFGTPHLNEGGLGGHMNHPYDRHDLSFADMKEMIARALQGRLDIEKAVTEKTDGQNIFTTFKDGQVKFARNKTERQNPLSVKELQSKFAGRGHISDAFGEAGNDLAAAFSKVTPSTLQSIFQNGKVFANMEIIYPATRNVISYDVAVLQFHNLVEYDDKGNVVQTDMTGGNTIQKAVEDANAHMQKTFTLIPPQKIKVGPVENFQDYQDALFKELDQLRNRYELEEKDKVTEYHIAWWREVIKAKALKVNYDIPDEILEILVNRWAFNNKSTSIAKVKKMIDNPEFLEWMTTFDKKDFKKYQKQNMEPFESVFLKLGAEVLKNASNFIAANPNQAVQQLKKELLKSIKDLRATNDIRQLDILKTQLKRIERLGGFDKIVPSEGIVFTFGGDTYKLTGAFAPINQILGTLKFSR